ncbi:MAG: pilus assembly protein PilP [Bdellovibrionales bacterium]|nr:pilus assembly protein PilP [Bdellovibrionales bacterium]
MSVRRTITIFVLLASASLAFAAGEVASPPPGLPPATSLPLATGSSPLAPPTPKLSGSADPFEGLLEDFQYDPVGKRDPFAPFSPPKIGTQGMVGPVFPLQRFSIEQLKLQGIIWDVNSPKALVVDPSNRAHIIVKDDRIGQRNGYVAQIREDEVIIVESIDLNGRTIYQTRVLRMVLNSEKKQ